MTTNDSMDGPGKKLRLEAPAEEQKPLDFERRGMVNWFNPGQLLDTALRSVLSAIFGMYADKREMQVVLEPRIYDEHAFEDELWIDYVADIGDGWNSTYTIATLLAHKELSLQHEQKSWSTRRGKILVMGGDQVYPTPKRNEYRNRLTGPYKSALPWLPEAERPHLFAIPGNHDWYDGLTNFIRVFCHQHGIGAWKTRQSRSYFAIKLPHNWWLWGIDIQFESRIDKPQLDYFSQVAKEALKKDDRIILCNALPSWIYATARSAEFYKNLDYFLKTIILEYGGTPQLMLAGDLHHYSRYSEGEGTGKFQKITSGGGGAFLHGTHDLPQQITLNEMEYERHYALKKTFPEAKTSRRLRFGALQLPYKSWQFSLFLGGFYLLLTWIAQGGYRTNGKTFLETISQHRASLKGSLIVVQEFYNAISYNALGLLFLLALFAGAIAFCDAPKKVVRAFLGFLHGAAHLALFLGLGWTFSYPLFTVWGLERGSLLEVVLVIFGMVVFGGFLGGLLMSIYLLLANLTFKVHNDAVIYCQSIEDYKNFLRLHIDQAGNLTVFPVGVAKVCKNWRRKINPKDDEPRFEPENGRAVAVHLIEKPIEL